jgi:hypothetical protein
MLEVSLEEWEKKVSMLKSLASLPDTSEAGLNRVLTKHKIGMERSYDFPKMVVFYPEDKKEYRVRIVVKTFAAKEVLTKVREKYEKYIRPFPIEDWLRDKLNTEYEILPVDDPRMEILEAIFRFVPRAEAKLFGEVENEDNPL